MENFLSVADADPDELRELLTLAGRLKARRASCRARGVSPVSNDLRGRSVVLVFEKPSLRTRASFEIGVQELGGIALPMWQHEIRLGERETVADTGRVLERYAQCLVIRTFGQDRLVELAAAVDVPVVNALTDHEHPCQALADLLTIHEACGGLTGRSVAYVGDGNNVAHSLMLAGAMVGMSVRVAHPPGHDPDEQVVAQARQLAKAHAAEVVVTTEVAVAVAGADAVYTDVWTSMGQEAQAAARRSVFVPYQVTRDVMAVAGRNAIFLHCLPAHRGEEVTAEVIDGPRARVFDQAENRLHAQKALLSTLLAS